MWQPTVVLSNMPWLVASTSTSMPPSGDLSGSRVCLDYEQDRGRAACVCVSGPRSGLRRAVVDGFGSLGRDVDVLAEVCVDLLDRGAGLGDVLARAVVGRAIFPSEDPLELRQREEPILEGELVLLRLRVLPALHERPVGNALRQRPSVVRRVVHRRLVLLDERPDLLADLLDDGRVHPAGVAHLHLRVGARDRDRRLDVGLQARQGQLTLLQLLGQQVAVSRGIGQLLLRQLVRGDDGEDGEQLHLLT